jgi:methylmalonyl-CoA mutase
MWPEVNKKLNQIFKAKVRPVYHDFESLKKQSIQHNGLGLKLLGVSGDQVLDPKVYDTIKKQVLQMYVVHFRQIF